MPDLPELPVPPQRCSLVTQTAASLRAGLLAGLWPERLPGERELARRLQVSRRTLRAALAELERQGWLDTTARQRRRALRGCGLPAPAAGRQVIGVLSPGSLLARPMTFVMDALRERLDEAGLRVEFHAQRSCYSARPAAALQRLTQEHPAAAWLILGAREPLQRWAQRRRLPCLLAGSCVPGLNLPSVDVDYHAACHHAGGVLWRKGHRRIALVLPRAALGGDVASEAGLRAALHGLPGARLQVLRHDGSAAHLGRLLDAAQGGPRPPTAYLVAHAAPVLTVMMHLLRRGIRLPEDVSVIARDDDPVLQAASPVVARYVTDPPLLVRRMVRALRRLAETGEWPPEAIRLVPAFVAGETLGPA